MSKLIKGDEDNLEGRVAIRAYDSEGYVLMLLANKPSEFEQLVNSCPVVPDEIASEVVEDCRDKLLQKDILYFGIIVPIFSEDKFKPAELDGNVVDAGKAKLHVFHTLFRAARQYFDEYDFQQEIKYLNEHTKQFGWYAETRADSEIKLLANTTESMFLHLSRELRSAVQKQQNYRGIIRKLSALFYPAPFGPDVTEYVNQVLQRKKNNELEKLYHDKIIAQINQKFEDAKPIYEKISKIERDKCENKK